MARSTKASNAVQRLIARSQGGGYSMLSLADGRFCLLQRRNDGQSEKLNAPLELAEFVEFVNKLDKLPAKRLSKLDEEFTKKLNKTVSPENRKI